MFNFLKKWFPEVPERPTNTGIILGPHNGANDPNVYVAGAASPIVWQQRLKGGNWNSFTWSKVKQLNVKNGKYYDNLGCTGNALATSIETQIFFHTGKQVQISRRWINKMAGTNQGALKGTGNYMDAPAEWVRKNGFVLESSYPTPDSWTVDEYYADIPVGKMDELAREGLKSKELWDFSYEFLQVSDPNLDHHLEQAPVTVVIPGHDICGIYSPDTSMKYRDSYEPWDKSTPVSNLQAALKFIVTPKNLQAFFMKFIDNPTVYLMAEIDTMQNLDNFKTSFPVNYPKYLVKEGITTLPVKKP